MDVKVTYSNTMWIGPHQKHIWEAADRMLAMQLTYALSESSK